MIEELKNTFEEFNKKISKKERITDIRMHNFNEFAKLGGLAVRIVFSSRYAR